MVSRFDVYLINLDESPSKDPKNTRPAVVISPDELNRNVATVIVAPLASTNARYPTRVEIDFLNAKRFVILDQIRTVEKDRLVKKIGTIDRTAQNTVATRLQELFAE
jgi:mRNA interferase MazF